MSDDNNESCVDLQCSVAGRSETANNKITHGYFEDLTIDRVPLEQRCCCGTCERPRCLRNTFTAEIENGVWQGGLSAGVKPLRTKCFWPTSDGDWFPITPRIKWTDKHCVCNDSCCCPDASACSLRIEPTPWECDKLRKRTCCDIEFTPAPLVQVVPSSISECEAASLRYEPVFSENGDVIYRLVRDETYDQCDNGDDENNSDLVSLSTDNSDKSTAAENDEDNGDEEIVVKPSCVFSQVIEKPYEQHRQQRTEPVTRQPKKLMSLVPNQSESYNFQRPIVRQYANACSVRGGADSRSTRFHGTSSFANEVNSAKWPGGFPPRSGVAICGVLF